MSMISIFRKKPRDLYAEWAGAEKAKVITLNSCMVHRPLPGSVEGNPKVMLETYQRGDIRLMRADDAERAAAKGQVRALDNDTAELIDRELLAVDADTCALTLTATGTVALNSGDAETKRKIEKCVKSFK